MWYKTFKSKQEIDVSMDAQHFFCAEPFLFPCKESICSFLLEMNIKYLQAVSLVKLLSCISKILYLGKGEEEVDVFIPRWLTLGQIELNVCCSARVVFLAEGGYCPERDGIRDTYDA